MCLSRTGSVTHFQFCGQCPHCKMGSCMFPVGADSNWCSCLWDARRRKRTGRYSTNKSRFICIEYINLEELHESTFIFIKPKILHLTSDTLMKLSSVVTQSRVKVIHGIQCTLTCDLEECIMYSICLYSMFVFV